MSNRHVKYVLVTKNKHIIENIIKNYSAYIAHQKYMPIWLEKLRNGSHSFSMNKEYVNGEGLRLSLWGEPEDNFPNLKKFELGPKRFLEIMKERVLAEPDIKHE